MKILKSGTFYFVVAALLAGACSAKKVVLDDASMTVGAKDVATLNVHWIKDKKSKFDVEFKLINDRSEGGLIVFLNEIRCGRGNLIGEMKHTFFNTGERTIDFKPGEVKLFRTVCNMGAQGTGPYYIEIRNFYDNPGMDGKTTGKVLAKNLRWTYTPSTK